MKYKKKFWDKILMSLHKTSKFLFFLMCEILNITLNEIVGNLLEEVGFSWTAKTFKWVKTWERDHFFFTSFTEQFTNKELFTLLFFHSDNICKVKQIHVLSTTSVMVNLKENKTATILQFLTDYIFIRTAIN